MQQNLKYHDGWAHTSYREYLPLKNKSYRPIPDAVDLAEQVCGLPDDRGHIRPDILAKHRLRDADTLRVAEMLIYT